MKHFIYICAIICSLVGVSSCQENDLETWHGEDGIYFYVQWGVDW